MAKHLPERWDLETFFVGGSGSDHLVAFLDDLETYVEALGQQVRSLPAPGAMAANGEWHKVLESLQEAYRRSMQVGSFLYCLQSQDVTDQQAKLLFGRSIQLEANIAAVDNALNEQILKTSEADWERLLEDARMKPIAFRLQERRERAKEEMPPALETLAADLGVDGYHGWNTLYETLAGRIQIPFEIDGKVEQLSVGQAHNKFHDADRGLRERLFAKWEEAWANDAELIGAALNNLSGFRLNLYKHRGWRNILKEPLENNRMTEATLNAMWNAINQGKDRLVTYLQRKAQLLGTDRLAWFDLSAPLGKSTTKMSYDDAGEFIVANFRKFSPQMADFAAHALEKGWIEAEDRPGKRPGGYCTDFPLHNESRIFMTYGGETGSVRTLAHELGHAYHSHVVFDLPMLNQLYASNVAETASTFAEILIGSAAIANAKTTEERLALLDSRLSDTVAYLMNIHARFLFEIAFYEERRKGPVSTERLNELMVAAQKEAYRDSLSQYHPQFWASKGHFYMASAPFYNYPYTFGFLFSAGIYARALEKGPTFEQRYVDLLRDTGRMTVEDLAARHLGVDLTKPDFWLSGVNTALADVDEFLKLTSATGQ